MPADVQRKRSDFPASLRGKRVLIDRLTRDAVAVAELLVARGASVQILATDEVPVEFEVGTLREQRRGFAEMLASSPGYATTPTMQPLDVEAVRNRGIEVLTGSGWSDATLDYDILVVDCDYHFLPPTPPSAPYIVRARASGKVVSSLADLVLQLAPARTAGVTGSAGKSTVTTLLGQILAEAGHTVYTPTDMINGNPYPNYELIEPIPRMKVTDWVIAEFTNFLLEYTTTSPSIGVVTNISPDHLDWHSSLEGYIQAKMTIVEYQQADDWAVLNFDDQTVMRQFAPVCRGKIAYFSEKNKVPQGVYCKGDVLTAVWDGQEMPIMTLDEVPTGRGYLGNPLAAATAALAAGVSVDIIKRGILNYRGLRERLQLLATIGGVRIFNDAMAVSVGKARACFESFDDNCLILICGGVVQFGEATLYGHPEEQRLLAEVCSLIARKAAGVILLGDAAPTLRSMIENADGGSPQLFDAPDMAAACQRAAELAAERVGNTILLAPVYYVPTDDHLVFDEVIVTAVEARMPSQIVARSSSEVT